MYYLLLLLRLKNRVNMKNLREEIKMMSVNPSITDGVHCNENFVEIIPVFSTFSNFFKKKEKKKL